MNKPTINRGIEERYLCAAATSNFRIPTDRTCGGDVILAAGALSPNNFGLLLLRLRAEFDQRGLVAQDGRDAALARNASLGSLPAALRQIGAALLRTVTLKQSKKISRAIVSYWLSPRCARCSGQRYRLIPGTPIKSNRRCEVCRGAGVDCSPFGELGIVVLRWMNDCVSFARIGLVHKLR